jgi:hypothetical protein
MSIWTSPSIWKLTGRKAPRTLLHGIWETRGGGGEVYIVLAHYDGAWATIKDIHTSRNIQSPPTSSLHIFPRCPFSLSFDWVGCSAWWHKHTDATAPLTTPPTSPNTFFFVIFYFWKIVFFLHPPFDDHYSRSKDTFFFNLLWCNTWNYQNCLKAVISRDDFEEFPVG